MCFIGGGIVSGRRPADQAQEVLRRLLRAGANRGVDGAGFAVITAGGTAAERDITGPEALSGRLELPAEPCAVLMNSRLEPTSEFCPDAGPSDLQPYRHDGLTIVHNGLIANDNELAARYGISRCDTGSPIDSALIPHLLSRMGSSSRERLSAFADQVIGSYALAVHDDRRPDVLTLACSFKPIWIAFSQRLDALLFASEPEQLRAALAGIDDIEVQRVEPYTGLIVDARRHLDGFSLDRRRSGGPALCVCSGGMDSTTAAAMVREAGRDIVFCNFQYGCRAEERERLAVEAIADYYGAKALFPPLHWLGELGGSTLTDSSRRIADGNRGVETPHEWVPARNLVLIAHAVALCERHGFGSVVLGTNEQEGEVFPDNELEFVDLLGRAVDIGSIDRITIEAPVGRMSKREIVRTALALDVPLHLTWSCYRSGRIPCGSCGSCLQRRVAFRQLGFEDAIEYAVPLPVDLGTGLGRPA